MIKRLIATILLTLTLSWQAEAARSYICGFEIGSTGEFFVVAGTTFQTTTVRTGTYALQVNPTANTANGSFKSVVAGGTFRNLFRSARFFLRVGSLPSGGNPNIYHALISGGADQDKIILNSTGTFTLTSCGNAGTQSSATISADSSWHMVQLEDISTTDRKLYLDGAMIVEDTGTCAQSGAAVNQLIIGADGIATTTNLYFDDFMADDGDAIIGSGQSILVKPTTDPVTLNSWTGGAGGTTNIWDAVNNVPPVGLAPASETNTSQIKNAASGGNLDYVATTQSYQTAGVGASDTVNGVMAIGNDCEEITTGTKAGGYWIGTNPAQTAGGQTFDFGNDTATVCGAFPTGWATHVGPVTTSGITIGSTATVAIRKTTSTTRVTDADFLGIYVDYTPFVAGAVKRLPLLGIGAWLLTQVTDIYNSLFEPSVAFATPSKNPHTTVDADFLGIYVDYTPSVVAAVSPHFVPTPTTSVR